MHNTSNPAELYIGTMWELIASDKYLKTTTGTPLSMGAVSYTHLRQILL